MSLADAVRARGARRLVHFTQARNLPHIIRNGRIRSRETLDLDVDATFAFADADRFDGRRDLTCLSIEYPNPYYLRHARQRARGYPDWPALLVDVEVLDWPDVWVCQRNAAAGPVVAATQDSVASLWADHVASRQGFFQRRLTHLPACPTDLQAEVLIAGDIPLSRVHGLMFPDIAGLRRVRVALAQTTDGWPSDWDWIVCATAFTPDDLRNHVWYGTVPEERRHD